MPWPLSQLALAVCEQTCKLPRSSSCVPTCRLRRTSFERAAHLLLGQPLVWTHLLHIMLRHVGDRQLRRHRAGEQREELPAMSSPSECSPGHCVSAWAPLSKKRQRALPGRRRGALQPAKAPPFSHKREIPSVRLNSEGNQRKRVVMPAAKH